MMLCYRHLSRSAGAVAKSWTAMLNNLQVQNQRSSPAAFSTSSVSESVRRYDLVIVGGGAGGCATAHMFSRKMGRGRVAIIEPADVRIYSIQFNFFISEYKFHIYVIELN